MATVQEIRKQRMESWLDAILDNIVDFEEAIDDIGPKDFKRARQEIIDQFRLIKLMKDVLDGKTKLDGYRYKKP